jgi:hypothetical protein
MDMASVQSVEDLDHGELALMQERVAAAKDGGAIRLGYYCLSRERPWPAARLETRRGAVPGSAVGRRGPEVEPSTMEGGPARGRSAAHGGCRG